MTNTSPPSTPKGGDTPAPTLLDAALIRSRRLELGLSERRLASRLGVYLTGTVLRSVEAGRNHADLTLGDVCRIAEHLDLPLHRVLTAAADPEPDGRGESTRSVGPVTQQEHLNTHVTKLGAILGEIGRALPEQTIAELLDVPLTGLEPVLVELDARLRKAGLRLHRLHGDTGIRPSESVTTRNTLQEAWRRYFARRSLNIGQVRLLAKAFGGRAAKSTSAGEALCSAALVNAGILQRSASGGFVLTDDVRYSLLLSDEADQG